MITPWHTGIPHSEDPCWICRYLSFSLVWASIPIYQFALLIELFALKLTSNSIGTNTSSENIPPSTLPHMKNFERTGGQTAYTFLCRPSKAGRTNPVGAQRMCYLLRTRQLIEHPASHIAENNKKPRSSIKLTFSAIGTLQSPCFLTIHPPAHLYMMIIYSH